MARRLCPQGCRLAQLPRHLRCRLGLVRVRDQRRWSHRGHQEGLEGLEAGCVSEYGMYKSRYTFYSFFGQWECGLSTGLGVSPVNVVRRFFSLLGDHWEHSS